MERERGIQEAHSSKNLKTWFLDNYIDVLI